MTIVMGADHGGFELKARIVDHLKACGYEVRNMGVDSGESVHYPDIALRVCLEFQAGEYDFGILICGTGIGVSIAANKIPGIRCANICSSYAARMARAHNNANFLAFGGRVDYPEPVPDMVDAFVRARFEGGRHQIRVGKIAEMEHLRRG
jgi:ribose 5-phosphate isomerase B